MPRRERARPRRRGGLTRGRGFEAYPGALGGGGGTARSRRAPAGRPAGRHPRRRPRALPSRPGRRLSRLEVAGGGGARRRWLSRGAKPLSGPMGLGTARGRGRGGRGAGSGAVRRPVVGAGCRCGPAVGSGVCGHVTPRSWVAWCGFRSIPGGRGRSRDCGWGRPWLPWARSPERSGSGCLPLPSSAGRVYPA